MEKRVVNVLDKMLDAVIVIVCVLLLIIGVYSMLDNLWLYENAQDRSILHYKPEQDALLTPDKKITENQVAWVTINDTTIDYPVMQGKDNYEYLNKNPYGEFSLSGSVFLDSRNKADFTDDYSLIYGHHMSGGVMFGALDAFKNVNYFKAHRTGTLTTQNAIYEIKLFAAGPANATDSVAFNPEGRSVSEMISYIRAHSAIFEEPEPGKRIIALSTCTGDTSVLRLIVYGTLTEKRHKDIALKDKQEDD